MYDIILLNLLYGSVYFLKVDFVYYVEANSRTKNSSMKNIVVLK